MSWCSFTRRTPTRATAGSFTAPPRTRDLAPLRLGRPKHEVRPGHVRVGDRHLRGKDRTVSAVHHPAGYPVTDDDLAGTSLFNLPHRVTAAVAAVHKDATD